MRPRPVAPLRVLPPLLLVAACGAPPAPPPPPVATLVVAVSSAEPAPPPPPAEPMPPVEVSLPAGAAALAVADTGKLDEIAGQILRELPKERATLEHGLHLQEGALSWRPTIALAVDTGRPILASLSITGGGRAAVEALRALAGGSAPPEALVGELLRVLQGTRGAALALRIVVPTVDAPATARCLTALLDGYWGWTAGAPPNGFLTLHTYREGEVFAAISSSPAAVVVDVVLPSAAAEGPKAARAVAVDVLHDLRARTAESPREEPLAVQGAVVRARYVPAAIADLGFLQGVGATARAVAHAAGDEGKRGAIAAQGLKEAAQVYKLAGDGQGAFFDRIELSVEGGYGALTARGRATPGPGRTLAPAPWAPGLAPWLPGAFAELDTSMAWLRSWEAFAFDPLKVTELRHAIREAGWAGGVVALPQDMVSGVGDVFADDLGRWPALLRRLERVGIASPKKHDNVYVGLFPAGTKPADLACLLADPGAPCGPDLRLRPGAVTKVESTFFRLVEAKGRWLLVAGTDRAIFDAAKPELRAVPIAPTRIEIPGRGMFADDIRPLPETLFPERLVFEVSLEAGQATLRIGPP